MNLLETVLKRMAGTFRRLNRILMNSRYVVNFYKPDFCDSHKYLQQHLSRADSENETVTS